jgi:hypothetical protein
MRARSSPAQASYRNRPTASEFSLFHEKKDTFILHRTDVYRVDQRRDISHYFWSGDLIRSLPVRSTSGLPVHVAASQPLHSRLHYASVEMTTPSQLLRFDFQFYRGREIGRQRRFKNFPISSAWMMKPKLPRMQHLTRKIFCKAWRINFIAEHGMAEMMKMHPNLMSASAVQPAFN